MRRLAILFLEATARGPLAEALAKGAGEADGGAPKPGGVALRSLLRAVGRFGGRCLTARAKVRIQEWLISRYRIPVDWQPREDLRRRLADAFTTLAAEAGDQPFGDYPEFGVYQGNSLICAHAALAAAGLDSVRLFGFDSFAGLPETAVDAATWSRGQFGSDYDVTLARLREAGVDLDRTRLVQGFFDDTLTPELYEREGLRRAGVILSDCDLYTSTVQALLFSRTLIHEHAFLFFDDFYSTDEEHGEQRALREFRRSHPELGCEEAGGYSEQSQVFMVRELRAAGSAARPGGASA